MKLVTSHQMRALEQRADASGNTFAMMMERAGRAVADALSARAAPKERVLVLVGPGNNGGDGLVCARYVHDRGAAVSLYVWKRAESADDTNLDLCRERNISVIRAENDKDFASLRKLLSESQVIVDALLGTGVTRPIEGTLREMLGVVRAAREKRDRWELTELVPSSPVTSERRGGPAQSAGRQPSLFIAAVDLPSGLNPDTGALDPATVPADLTVTFAFPKVGQLLYPGAGAVGELVVADIGIPAEWAAEIDLEVATVPEIAARLPARPRNSHKGTFGKAMICAGSLNYIGAAYLAGTAATRAGAGLVTLAIARAIHPIVASAAHETTFVPLPDDNGALVPAAVEPLLNALENYDALLIGPGFGRNPRTVEFVRQILEQIANPPTWLRTGLPYVIDADALYALSHIPDWWTHRAPGSTVLTPHPGEMATLSGMKVSEIQANRMVVAKRFAMEWKQIVLLKGAHTVIAAPDGRVTLIPFATPALATAGTGDVLAGAIAAMLAQKLEPFDAAVVGSYLHGLAGKIAEEEIGRAGVVAGDLLPRLPQALRRVWEYGSNQLIPTLPYSSINA